MRNRGDTDHSRELCAVLGHELRNPLASAITRIGVATALMDPGDPRAEHLRSATDDLERLSSLLTAYLEFGRERRVTRRKIDLANVVRAVASRNACTRLEVAADSVPVAGDAELLGRALDNMIENAFEAGATDVKIELSHREGAAVLDISDDGPGVPVDLRERLFEPFVSGRGSSGLGLAVARDVVECQGGQISLCERRRGGAMFRIILPLDGAPIESALVPVP